MHNNQITAFDRLLDRLEVRRNGSTKATALCPVHEADGQKHTPSLSITCIEGQVLVHCHRGCHIDDVLAALDLSKRDLFDNSKGVSYRYGDGRIVHRTPDKAFPQSGNKTASRRCTAYPRSSRQSETASGSTSAKAKKMCTRSKPSE